MKLRYLLLTCSLLVAACALVTHHGGTILYAQSLPATFHANWDKNPAVNNVVSYKVILDGGVPLTLLATACQATCLQTITLNAFGAHVISLVAQNLLNTNDPTSFQDSTPVTVNWFLQQKPATPAAPTITP